MPDVNPVHLWRRFLALPNDSLFKTLSVSFLVAVSCATAVSVTAVMLKPLQESQSRERQASASRSHDC
jgi:Na+-transporting NADH:ubiquinone oxidoreductase subunit C